MTWTPEKIAAHELKLPYFRLPEPDMELFDPDRHGHDEGKGDQHALPLYLAVRKHPALTLIPREEDCFALWDAYRMPLHIQEHCRKVGLLAHGMALAAALKGVRVYPEAALAAGYLHDLGKIHSIELGGHHDQIGAAWVMRETRNGPISQAALYHTGWRWPEMPAKDIPILCQLCIYADKRVMHDTYVSLDQRFEYLIERYGKTEVSRRYLAAGQEQVKAIEAALSNLIGVPVNEYIADRRGLVPGA